MCKECLRHGITPFVIADALKLFYDRGLARWDEERGWLMDTCLSAQDTFKEWLDYFRIPYDARRRPSGPCYVNTSAYQVDNR
jgi:hypothetical protein